MLFRPARLLTRQLGRDQAPARVGGLTAWLRADRGITLNGSDVSGWADQSGNGNDASQGTALNQPAYNTSWSNGRPALTFDGTNHFMEVNTLAAMFVNRAPFTLFCVAQATDTAGFYNYVGSGSSTVGSRLIEWRQAPTVLHEFVSRDDDGTPEASATGGTADTASHIHVISYAGGLSAALKSWQNNTAVIDTTYTSSSTTQTLDQTAIGAFPQIAARINLFKGNIAEVIAYNNVISDADRVSVQNSLSARYGIALA